MDFALARNNDAAFLLSNANCIRSLQCSSYVEFNALFSFTMFSQLACNLIAHLKLRKIKSKHWISLKSRKF